MADGTSYEIELLVSSVGAQSSADELNALAGKLDAASAVSTSFDTALERTKALLADASAAAQQASAAVAAGAQKYGELETASTRAAKAVERAALKGQDTTALQAQADAAAAAVAAQAATLDDLKASAASAAAAEDKLKASMKSLEAAAKAEATEIANASKEAEKLAAAQKRARQEDVKVDEITKKALGPLGEKTERIKAMAKTLSEAGVAGGAGVAAVALIAFAAAVAYGVYQLARMAVEVNKKAMEKLAKVSEKAHKNLAKLFEGVHVEKFVDALDKLTDTFGQNTAAGQGLKAVISALLNPLFDKSSALLPVIDALFRGMVLGALWVAIACVKASKAIAALIPDGVLSGANTMRNVMYGAAVAMVVLLAVTALLTVAGTILAVVLGVVIVAAAIGLALMIFWAVGAIVLLAAILLAPVIAIILLIAYFDEIVAYLGTLGSAALAAGKGIIDGLVNSITSGAGVVWDAIKSLGSGAMNALKGALGIASPSRFAAEYANNVTTTFASETDEGAPEAHAAMASLAEPPDMPQRGGAAAGARGGVGGGRSVSIGELHIHAPSGDARDIRAAFEEWYTGVLDGDARQLAGAT